jgi:translation initiation factor 2 subunit 2
MYSLNRQPEHVLAFVLAELGATGSIGGDDKLIIKGRFQSKQLENVLKKYIGTFFFSKKNDDCLLLFEILN